MWRSEDNSHSLVDLYRKRREQLLAELSQCDPAEAANRVSRFIRDLERPYTDLPTVTDFQARFAHHVLGVIAVAAEMLTAVAVTITVPGPEVLAPVSRQTEISLLKRLLFFLLKSAHRSTDRTGWTAVYYLWGITVTCIIAVVLVLLSDPAVIPVVLLVIIGMLATAGAANIHTRAAQNTTTLPLPEPKATLSVDINTMDGRLSAALHAADELLTVIARQPAGHSGDDLRLDPDRMLALLQELSAHRIVPSPEKTAHDLAGDAIRLLRTARLRLVDYSADHAHCFDEQPAGLSEPQTLVPALVRDGPQQTLVRKGIVLVPIG